LLVVRATVTDGDMYVHDVGPLHDRTSNTVTYRSDTTALLCQSNMTGSMTGVVHKESDRGALDTGQHREHSHKSEHTTSIITRNVETDLQILDINSTFLVEMH